MRDDPTYSSAALSTQSCRSSVQELQDEALQKVVDDYKIGASASDE